MKCFYHPGADAVGSCKHCSRGLCRACAGEAESLACPQRHETQVAQLDKLVAANIRLSGGSHFNLFIIPVLFLATGAGFALYAAGHPGFETFYLLGGFLVLFGAVRLYSVFRYLSIRNS
ncbi:MAG TPA: SoxR reducing system RseC family protein [Rhizomicrobium sp.]|nr:SoxR reducing system RseC family protein [Rhizomicrobium sp.]